MGYFDIPIEFSCPRCGTKLSGKKFTDFRFEINNAVECDESDEYEYYQTFSVEFPHRKIVKKDPDQKIIIDGFSPFMLTFSTVGQEYPKIMEKLNKYLEYLDNIWPNLKIAYDLFDHKKYQYMDEHFQKISDKYIIDNELNGLMALHHIKTQNTLYITPKLINDKIYGLTKEITCLTVKNNTIEFIDRLNRELFFTNSFNRYLEIMNLWNENFLNFFPAIVLYLGNAADKIDKKKYGMSTISYDKLMDFYSKSYELIADMSILICGMNNIFHRGDYNLFLSKQMDFDKLMSPRKLDRLAHINGDERFSLNIQLNNKVRNAISHFTRQIDNNTQLITFDDRNKINEMYLMDLAILCVENYYVLLYLDEIAYILKRNDLTYKGQIFNKDPNKWD